MEFEDLQVVWNSQHQQPLYGVNEEGLHKTLRNKSRRFRRLIFWQHVQTYGSSTFAIMAILILLALNASGVLESMGSTRALRALNGWEIAALLVALLCWLKFPLATYLGYQQQKKQEQERCVSLRDDLDREIKRTQFQIKTRTHILLGFIPPYVGTGLFICIVFGVTGISAWKLILVIGFLVVALIFESRCQRRFVEREIIPQLRDLEALHEKLTAPQPDPN